MRTLGLLLLIATAAMAQAPVTEAPAPKPIGTVDDLMLGVIWPNSDEVFYISRGAPKTDEEWQIASTTKNQMLRMDSSFKEKSLGYKSFTDFIGSRSNVVEVKEGAPTNQPRLRLRDRG